MWKSLRNVGLTVALATLAVMAELAGGGARAQQPAAQNAPAQNDLARNAGLPTVSLSGPCLRSGHGYLRARIRGAVSLDVDVHGARLACEGGPRFDGSGLRMGFEGRVTPGGRRVRMLFGIDGAREGRPGRELPTNLTVIFEGERQLFATQGDGNCTVDTLRQKRIGDDQGPTLSYLVTAHGFCFAPANDLSGKRRILITTFDFAGRADFERAPPRADSPKTH